MLSLLKTEWPHCDFPAVMGQNLRNCEPKSIFPTWSCSCWVFHILILWWQGMNIVPDRISQNFTDVEITLRELRAESWEFLFRSWVLCYSIAVEFEWRICSRHRYAFETIVYQPFHLLIHLLICIMVCLFCPKLKFFASRSLQHYNEDQHVSNCCWRKAVENRMKVKDTM